VWHSKVFNRTGFIAPFALRTVSGLCFFDPFLCFWWEEQDVLSWFNRSFFSFCFIFFRVFVMVDAAVLHFLNQGLVFIWAKEKIWRWRPGTIGTQYTAPTVGFSLMMRYLKACLICSISHLTNCFSVEFVDQYRGKRGHRGQLMVVNVRICLRTERHWHGLSKEENKRTAEHGLDNGCFYQARSDLRQSHILSSFARERNEPFNGAACCIIARLSLCCSNA